jgi:hypothetical protein
MPLHIASIPTENPFEEGEHTERNIRRDGDTVTLIQYDRLVDIKDESLRVKKLTEATVRLRNLRQAREVLKKAERGAGGGTTQ